MKKTDCIPLHAGLKKFLRIMRITTAIIFVLSMQVYAKSFGQVDKINLKMNSNFKEVIEQLEKISGYRFVLKYDQSILDEKVNVDYVNERIDRILDDLLKDTGFTYKVIDRYIAIVPTGEANNADQQESVSGKVTDSSGAPLPGVSVVIKGTTTGTITDAAGGYLLSNVPDKATLVFSFVGMKTQEIVAAGKTTVNVVLADESIGLEEVVAVGYGVQKKVNMTGSVSSVKTESLLTIPAANLSNTIAGRAAGVTVVNSSGLAGASSNIRIRGSFAEPLYVINGIIKGKTDFDALDAAEVESVNFLKDAATAAIYGSKAGNGVVLVTTKSGSKQKPKFEYKGSVTTARTTRPVQDYTATEELEYMNNVAVTQGQPKPYSSEIFDYFKDKNYRINDYIWQNPNVQQHNLSVNGGSEALTYFLSMGYHTEEGSYKNLNYDRYNFRSDVTAKITERFNVNINLSGNQRTYHRWYWPYDGAEDFNVGDFYRATFNWTRLYPFYVDKNGNPSTNTNDYPVSPGSWNPVFLMLNSGAYRDIKYRTLDGIIRFNWDLGSVVKGLSSHFAVNYSGTDRNGKAFIIQNKTYILQRQGGANPFVTAPIDPVKINIHNLSSNYNTVAEEFSLGSSYQVNWDLSYARTFGKHAVSALAVYERAHDNSKALNGQAEDLLTTQIDQIFNASSDRLKRWFNGSEGESARESWIGRTSYSYADKYMAEFSFRYDGNYKFIKEKRWGFFPSFSAGWRVSEEEFMKSVPYLSNLKLRASYGTTGSDYDYQNDRPIEAFRWSQIYNKTTGFMFGDAYYDGLTPGPMPNPNITWSTLKNWNAGFEYGLFENRLSGEFDVWGKKESDILWTRLGSTPSTLGASLPAVNYAARSFNGYEISVSWNDKISDLKYSVYGNMGYSKDKWDVFDEAAALTDGTYKDNWRSIIGKPQDRVYGYISKGIIRTQEQLDALPAGYQQFGQTPKLGMILYEDIRGDNFKEGADGKIDGNDQTYLSDNGIPRINYGFGFNLEWKGLAVNAHFQGVGSYDRMVSTRNTSGVFQIDRPYFEIWASNYWTPENPNAKYPRVANEWDNGNYGGQGSTFWIRNGAYLRLKNLDINYTLPQKWYTNLGLSSVKAFVNGTNLFSIDGIDEHDPEQKTLDSYPVMKTYTAGLIVNF